MQELSYTFKNPVFQCGGVRFSVMVYSFVNAYSLDEARTEVAETGDGLRVRCTGLLGMGGQVEYAGGVDITAATGGSSVKIDINAALGNCTENIRCVKLTVHGVADGKIINLIDARPRVIPAEGLSLHYPEGWRDVGTPLLIMKADEGEALHYFKSLDTRVRDKRFVFTRGTGALDAELIFEENATEMTNRVKVPTWEIGRGDSLDAIYKPHMQLVEQAYGLQPWETRADVPAWARQISLVATIHCQHWTGYIFNDYKDVLRQLEAVRKQVPAERVLAYLPGWEGRYYWQYGDFRPDERMGGRDGFKALCREAKAMGVHVMPMFGINVAGTHFPGYQEWGEPCESRTASGNIGAGSVDWDASRHYDHGSNRSLNPAAPKWQNRLYGQVTSLMDEYGFDSAFFDIAAVWHNDPNHYLYDGVKKLMGRLKQHSPDMLLAGEAWYDGLAACIPLLQCGHTDGVLHWHDDAFAPAFDTCARNFGHVCQGDPSRLSTGAHELGSNPEWRTPLRKGVIPTISIVEDSLEKAPERCAQIFEDANRYWELFCSGNR